MRMRDCVSLGELAAVSSESVPSILSSSPHSVEQFLDTGKKKKDMINTWSCSLVSILLAEAVGAMIKSLPAFLYCGLRN